MSLKLNLKNESIESTTVEIQYEFETVLRRLLKEYLQQQKFSMSLKRLKILLIWINLQQQKFSMSLKRTWSCEYDASTTVEIQYEFETMFYIIDNKNLQQQKFSMSLKRKIIHKPIQSTTVEIQYEFETYNPTAGLFNLQQQKFSMSLKLHIVHWNVLIYNSRNLV